MYAYTFLCDFVLLYPVYAVLFTDTGLSAADVSSLFVLWSVTGFVVEVPSGIWADVVSRRRLVALAPALSGAGFVLWALYPCYPSFAIGFVLWGAGGALQSGALQALVYTELDRLGATASYERLTGRAQALATTAVMAASAVAAPVLAIGGYQALGVASGAVCLVASAVALTLPDSRGGPSPDSESESESDDSDSDSDDDDDDDELTYREALRAGIGQLRHARPVRRAVAVVVVLAGLTTLDEYLPLLAQAGGADGPTVALLMLVVMVGSVVGGWLAGRGTHRLPAVLAVGGGCLALGAMAGRAEGMILLAVAYGCFEWAMIGADARLQERVPDRVRATVTSIAGLGTEMAAVTAYAGFALGSVWSGPGPLFAVAGAGYVVLGALLALRRLSPLRRSPLGAPIPTPDHEIP